MSRQKNRQFSASPLCTALSCSAALSCVLCFFEIYLQIKSLKIAFPPISSPPSSSGRVEQVLNQTHNSSNNEINFLLFFNYNQFAKHFRISSSAAAAVVRRRCCSIECEILENLFNCCARQVVSQKIKPEQSAARSMTS